MSQASDGEIIILKKRMGNVLMRLEALEQRLAALEAPAEPETPAAFKPKATKLA